MFVSLRYCYRLKCDGVKVYYKKDTNTYTTIKPPNNFSTFYQAVASVNEKDALAGTYDDCTEIEASDLTTPSAYIINSLGETFFSKFENARKIQNLAGQSVGTDKVLRPMMYVISQS